MKYSVEGFRPFYYQFIIFPIEASGSAVSGFGHSAEADSILTFGYIDHETGFRFEVISTAVARDGDLKIYNDRPEDERVFIKAEAVSDVEGTILEGRDELYAGYKDHIDSIIEGYGYNEEVMKTRAMDFLDGSRDPICVDDVEVMLVRNGLEPEMCWTRIEGLYEQYIMGKLLNEPYQDFGYHMDETIGFYAQKTEDGQVICVCDMNPSTEISKEDLKDGVMLKEAVRRFNEDRNESTLFDVLEILRDSDVLVPCNAVFSAADQEAIKNLVEEAGDDLSKIEGKTMTSQDQIRMIPDILKNGDDFFFPVFSSQEDMGEYGNGFSIIEMEFLNAIALARNSDKQVKGIVVNAFSEPFVLDAEIFDIVERMKSRIVKNTA